MSNKNFLIKNGLSIGADNEVISSARAGSFSAATITGDLTVDSSTLKVDSSNNRVGIGTTSPQAPLHVSHATAPNFRLSRTGTGQIYQMGIDSSGRFLIEEAASEGGTRNARLVIDDSGEVGIGVSAPTGKLEIAATGTNAAPHIKLVEDSDTREFNIFNDGSGNGRLVLADSDDDTPDTEIVLADNGVLQFKNATHESMTINSDGYVTISRNASEYGLELRSTGTRSGLVLATPNSGNTIKGSLLLLTDNTLRLGTQSVYNIHMNQSGHNTMPNQPYMRCYGNYGGMATNHGTTADPWNYWAVGSSSGITHSNGVFTVPTTGRYLITYSFYNWMNNTGQGVTHAVYLYIGSTNVQETNNEFDMGNNSYSYYDNVLSNSIVYNLTAGDTFKFVTYADIYGGTSHTNMSAYLLG